MNVLADQQNVRNLKDFLLLYNRLTEQCFNRCVSSLNHRIVSKEENDCIGVCADRFVGFNQRLMFVFMEHQNMKRQVAAKEAERQMQETEQEALANLAQNTPSANETLINSTKSQSSTS